MEYICNKPIAILLAAYNAELYLSQQIDSILGQTYREWILYIRNDASTDRTQDVIEQYTKAYPDKIIQIDKEGVNLGCRNNFFRLLEVVNAEYYMFCDADDVWFEDKIKDLLEVIKEAEKENSNIPILAYGDTTVCDENLNILVPSYWKAMNLNPERLISYNYMAICCTAGGSCSIFNTNVKNLLFPLVDNDLMYDYWIALNVSKCGKLKVLNKPVTYYRQHGNNVCGVTLSSPLSRFVTLKNIFSQIKKYQIEIKQLKRIGYGSALKFYYYKFLVLLMRKNIL